MHLVKCSGRSGGPDLPLTLTDYRTDVFSRGLSATSLIVPSSWFIPVHFQCNGEPWNPTKIIDVETKSVACGGQAMQVNRPLVGDPFFLPLMHKGLQPVTSYMFGVPSQ